MHTSREASADIPSKLIAGAVFLCASACTSAFLIFQGGQLPDPVVDWQAPDEIAAVSGALAFLCACVLVFLRPRLGYGVALLAGLLEMPLFVRIEISLGSWNSWIFLNHDGFTYFAEIPAFAELRILSCALIVVAVATASFRLLPVRWRLRKSPLCQNFWPTLVFSLLVLSVWFVHSVTPYSVAGFDHSRSELRILHIRKSGFWFDETTIIEGRNATAAIIRQGRRLFQYQSEGRVARVPLARWPKILENSHSFVQSPALWKLHTPPAKALRSWNAEGWYVVLKDSRLLAFTSEYGTTPPIEVTALFHEIERLPPSYEWPVVVRDVCLGFCYDPMAALGFSILKQRSRLISLNLQAGTSLNP